MTFKDLRKRVSLEEETIQQQSKLFERLRNKPFWICDIQKHKQEDIRTKGDCCFNHIIGLPKKDEVEKPIFDYEMQLLNALDNHKSVFVKKARGLGITEILLRYMAWLAVFDDTYHNCRFHIVTGPRINLAELIDIIRLLFQNAKTPIMLKQIGPIIYFNNVTIQAFPSHTVSTMRIYRCQVYFHRLSCLFSNRSARRSQSSMRRLQSKNKSAYCSCIHSIQAR